MLMCLISFRFVFNSIFRKEVDEESDDEEELYSKHKIN